jgi:hypothetical protein
MSHEDRQFAALFIGAVFLFGVPVIIFGPMLLVSAWMAILGLHPHRLLWAWVSSQTPEIDPKTKDHYLRWDVANWCWAYPLFVLTAYLIYQICEGVWFCGSESYKALSRPIKSKY